MGLLDRYIYETHEWAKGYIYERFAIDIYDCDWLPKVDIEVRGVRGNMLYDYYELTLSYYHKVKGKRVLYCDALNSIMFIHLLYYLDVISGSEFYSFMETNSKNFDKFLLENKHMNFLIENQYYDLEEEKIEVTINIE